MDLASTASYYRKVESKYSIDTYICCVVVASCRVLEGIWYKVVLRTLIDVEPTEWHIHNDHTPAQYTTQQPSPAKHRIVIR